MHWIVWMIGALCMVGLAVMALAVWSKKKDAPGNPKYKDASCQDLGLGGLAVVGLAPVGSAILQGIHSVCGSIPEYEKEELVEK